MGPDSVSVDVEQPLKGDQEMTAIISLGVVYAAPEIPGIPA